MDTRTNCPLETKFFLKRNITLICKNFLLIVLIFDGNSEHAAHTWRKIGLFKHLFGPLYPKIIPSNSY